MEIKARMKDNVVILDLIGRIDVNAASLVEAVGQCVRDGYLDILCNLEEVDFIDYLGISAVALAYKETANNGGRMKLLNVPAHLKHMFSVTGLDRAVEIYASEDLAVNSFKEDKIIENIQKLQLRRRFKRLPIDIKIELKDKYEKSPSCLKADILNLSAVGAYIYGCEKFNLGDAVMIKFTLPPDAREFEVEAKVVWLCDKQVQQHLYPGIGIEFVNLSSAMQEKIASFIERNLSLSPSDD